MAAISPLRAFIKIHLGISSYGSKPGPGLENWVSRIARRVAKQSTQAEVDALINDGTKPEWLTDEYLTAACDHKSEAGLF